MDIYLNDVWSTTGEYHGDTLWTRIVEEGRNEWYGRYLHSVVVYQDSCPGQEGVQCIAGADLNLPGGEEVTVAVQAGGHYFIVVDGYAASSLGNYYLHVDEVDP